MLRVWRTGAIAARRQGCRLKGTCATAPSTAAFRRRICKRPSTLICLSLRLPKKALHTQKNAIAIHFYHSSTYGVKSRQAKSSRGGTGGVGDGVRGGLQRPCIRRRDTRLGATAHHAGAQSAIRLKSVYVRVAKVCMLFHPGPARSFRAPAHVPAHEGDQVQLAGKPGKFFSPGSC